MFGAGGGTCSYREIEEVDVVLLWGSNAREAHPIFFHHLLKGLDNGRLYREIAVRYEICFSKDRDFVRRAAEAEGEGCALSRLGRAVATGRTASGYSALR